LSDWPALAAGLKAASGPDIALDEAIVEALGVPAAGYTESVAECRRLVALALPNGHLHVGFGVSGIFPYCVVRDGALRGEAEAPTVPLAILRALVDVLRERQPVEEALGD